MRCPLKDCRSSQPVLVSGWAALCLKACCCLAKMLQLGRLMSLKICIYIQHCWQLNVQQQQAPRHLVIVMGPRAQVVGLLSIMMTSRSALLHHDHGRTVLCSSTMIERCIASVEAPSIYRLTRWKLSILVWSLQAYTT